MTLHFGKQPRQTRHIGKGRPSDIDARRLRPGGGRPRGHPRAGRGQHGRHVLLVDLQHGDRLERHDQQLGDAVSRGDLERDLAVGVQQQHAQLAAVAGVD